MVDNAGDRQRAELRAREVSGVFEVHPLIERARTSQVPTWMVHADGGLLLAR